MTCVAMIYPTQVLVIIETNNEALIKLIRRWKEREPNPERIVVKYNIVNMAVDVERKIKSFHAKVLNQPLPMPHWLPPGGLSNTAAETLAKRILRQIEDMITFVGQHGREKKVMENLVEQRPETVPDQDPLLFVNRSGIFQSTGDYIDKYTSPFNVELSNDTTWPGNWPGKRLPCSLSMHEESLDECWGVDLVGLSSVGRIVSGISRVGFAGSNSAQASAIPASTNRSASAAYRKSEVQYT